MKITIDRYKSNADATLSRDSIDGEFECFGLEDEYREIKVPGKTRIPAGEYPVTLRAEGGMHGRYSVADWCKDWHKGMLWVRDVPGFEWIYIHPGNTHLHTEGCLLTGEQANDNFTISRSRIAYERFYKKVFDAALNGDLTIEYIDNDR